VNPIYSFKLSCKLKSSKSTTCYCTYGVAAKTILFTVSLTFGVSHDNSLVRKEK